MDQPPKKPGDHSVPHQLKPPFMGRSLKRILITLGEPAGIGPDITLMAAGKPWPAMLIAVGDMDCLAARAEALGLSVRLQPWHPDLATRPHQPHTLPVLHVPLQVPCKPGHPDPANAASVINSLKIAGELCLDKKADALVTGPVHKAVLSTAGLPFTGHTEFFAVLSGASQPVMLFLTEAGRVALLTTHLPLADVPRAVTAGRLRNVLRVLHHGLRDAFHIRSPHIVVCGLNPHAGDEGLLGDEEQRIIIPTLSALRQEGLNLTGPVAADTAFLPDKLSSADAILAMYHDQALPVVKQMSFGHAVNLTLGLPFIRTSVDHGVAFDAAGNGSADPGSLMAAIHAAITLVGYSE